jgi:hypothetical protein
VGQEEAVGEAHGKRKRIPRFFGDYIYNPAQGIGAIEGRLGAPDNLDTFYVGQGHSVPVQALGDPAGHPLAVNKVEYPAFAHALELNIVAHGAAGGHKAIVIENFRYRTGAGIFNFLRRYNLSNHRAVFEAFFRAGAGNGDFSQIKNLAGIPDRLAPVLGKDGQGQEAAERQEYRKFT